MANDLDPRDPWPRSLVRSLSIVATPALAVSRAEYRDRHQRPLNRGYGTPHVPRVDSWAEDAGTPTRRRSQSGEWMRTTNTASCNELTTLLAAAAKPAARAASALEPAEEEAAPAPFLTPTQGVFAMTNSLCGIGMISLPYAFALAGWAGGFGVLFVLAAATNYTGKVLGCLMEQPGVGSVAGIAQAALGVRGRWGIASALCVGRAAAALPPPPARRRLTALSLQKKVR